MGLKTASGHFNGNCSPGTAAESLLTSGTIICCVACLDQSLHRLYTRVMPSMWNLFCFTVGGEKKVLKMWNLHRLNKQTNINNGSCFQSKVPSQKVSETFVKMVYGEKLFGQQEFFFISIAVLRSLGQTSSAWLCCNQRHFQSWPDSPTLDINHLLDYDANKLSVLKTCVLSTFSDT